MGIKQLGENKEINSFVCLICHQYWARMFGEKLGRNSKRCVSISLARRIYFSSWDEQQLNDLPLRTVQLENDVLLTFSLLKNPRVQMWENLEQGNRPRNLTWLSCRSFMERLQIFKPSICRGEIGRLASGLEKNWLWVFFGLEIR